MEDTRRVPSPIRFGIFEVDLQSGELRRQGLKVKLQEQPFQVLMMLLERPGEVVTREELQTKLWPSDTFVDFERGLNRAINKLREALADEAASPRFIETIPRRGYRFLAPVEPARILEAEGTDRSRLAIVLPESTYTGATVADAKRPVLPWICAGILAILLVATLWRPWQGSPIIAGRPFLQLDVDLGPDEFSQPALTPDGMRIVFVSKRGLSIRHLDQTGVTRIAGTDGAEYPFFSPNGQWVGFFADGKLRKVVIDGGSPTTLCDAPRAAGGTWGEDEQIVATLNTSEGLSRVPAAGGTPQLLADSKGDVAGATIYRWPQTLPGGKGILFAAINGSEKGSLRVLTPHDGIKTVVENSTHGRYLASGYLVYHRQGTLFAAPMDLGRMELTGPAVPLVEGVSHSGGRVNFDLSASGALVYRGGLAGTASTMSWLYASGKMEPMLAKPGNYVTPRLSPDGTRVALSVIQGGQQNLWIYDLARGTWTRLTSDTVADLLPTWSPDGEFLAFRSGNTLAWIRSDGTGKVDRLAGVSRNAGPWSFSADGKRLAFWPLQPHSDLWTAPVERTPGSLRLGEPQVLLQQAGSKGAPTISPDGRWVAYTSDESGRFETYVMPFSSEPAAAPQGESRSGKWLISSGGGWSPIFSRSGRELFYQDVNRRVQVVSYTDRDDMFVAQKPRVWSETRLGDTGFFHGFDVAPDGKRVLALLAAEDPEAQTLLHVLLNVDSELRRRTSSRGK